MDFKAIVDLLHRAANSAGPIKHLIEAGMPVMQAVHQQAPELSAAIKEIVAANVPKTPAPATTLTHEEAQEAVAKAIFAPQKIDQHEKAWMDRASSGTSG